MGVRSDALTELRRYDDAVVAVQQLLELSPGTVDGLAADPAHLPLLAGRAKVLAATGEVTAATADYRRVVKQQIGRAHV